VQNGRSRHQPSQARLADSGPLEFVKKVTYSLLQYHNSADSRPPERAGGFESEALALPAFDVCDPSQARVRSVWPSL
jgi:hypothetical protein